MASKNASTTNSRPRHALKSLEPIEFFMLLPCTSHQYFLFFFSVCLDFLALRKPGNKKAASEQKRQRNKGQR
jgi:hypothetical protein